MWSFMSPKARMLSYSELQSSNLFWSKFKAKDSICQFKSLTWIIFYFKSLNDNKVRVWRIESLFCDVERSSETYNKSPIGQWTPEMCWHEIVSWFRGLKLLKCTGKNRRHLDTQSPKKQTNTNFSSLKIVIAMPTFQLYTHQLIKCHRLFCIFFSDIFSN